jgi:hypothetical protein
MPIPHLFQPERVLSVGVLLELAATSQKQVAKKVIHRELPKLPAEHRILWQI